MVKETRLYDLIGVSPGASDAEMKKSYRKKAMKYHPDRNPEAGNKFQEITMAYDTLSDPEKREVYDRYGEEGLSEGRGGGGGGGMDDILQSMFGFGGGGGRGRQRQRKTEDMKQAFPVSLEQFYNGVTRKIKVTRKVVCTGCGGVGGKKGSSKPCRGCDGHGVRVQLMQVGIGMVQQVRTACTDCDGTGEIIAAKDRCQTCNGKKVKAERKALEVHIDKGMKHGQNITFRGEGEQEPGLEPGDVVLVLQQKEHETFTRKGNHLIMNKTVSLTEALCGLTFHVKHLDGRVLAIQSIPGNVIRPGTIQIVKGEGMPQYRDVYSKGDLLIKFDVETSFPRDFDFHSDAFVAAVSAILPPKQDPGPIPEDAEEVYFEDVDPETFGKRSRGQSSAYDEDDGRRGGHAHMGGGMGPAQCAQQ